MWVPLQKKKRPNKKKWKETDRRWVSSREFFFFFFSFYFSNLLSQIHGNMTVGIRRDKHEKVLYATRATRGYQKHGISLRIQVNIRKILNFLFFSDLRYSSGQHFSDQ